MTMEQMVRRLVQQVDEQQEHMTMLERTLRHLTSMHVPRRNAAVWMRVDGTVAGEERFDLRSMLGGSPATDITVIALNGTTVDITVNGEPHAALPSAAVDDSIVEESIETVIIDVTSTGTGDVLVRATGYVGPGA